MVKKETDGTDYRVITFYGRAVALSFPEQSSMGVCVCVCACARGW